MLKKRVKSVKQLRAKPAKHKPKKARSPGLVKTRLKLRQRGY
jgi:hypothetical protein